jgi:hypothetical protein
MFKKLAKTFAGLIFFCNFAIPKLEQNAPNQLSFNELGTNKEILKTLQQCYSLKEQNSEGNRKTA